MCVHIRHRAARHFGVFGAGLVSSWAFWTASPFSTFFVASAGLARVVADALSVFGLVQNDKATRQFWLRLLSGIIPVCCFTFYSFVKAPVFLILLSGLTQAIMLPMLAFAALYFRYRRCHPQLQPGRWWDLFLWLSSVGLIIAGVWAALTRIVPALI